VSKTYFVLDQLEQPRQNKKLLYRHDKPNEPTKKGPLSFVLVESPVISFSTVSRGHPSLVSLFVHIATSHLVLVGIHPPEDNNFVSNFKKEKKYI
jgi:hypothetical protein